MSLNHLLVGGLTPDLSLRGSSVNLSGTNGPLIFTNGTNNTTKLSVLPGTNNTTVSLVAPNINSNLVLSTRGLVTQTVSPTSSVTNNGTSCRINCVNQALDGSEPPVVFKFFNNQITSLSYIMISICGFVGTTDGAPIAYVNNQVNGSVDIVIGNGAANAGWNGVLSLLILII